MPPNDREQIERLQRTIETLTSRVDGLTKRLDALANTPSPAPPSSPTPPPPPPPSAAAAAQVTIAPPISPQTSTGTSTPPAKPSPASPSIPKRVSSPTSKPTRAPRFDPTKLEWLLGIKGLMLLGVVIVIIGVGMFLKLANDEGWIASISPALRCSMAGAFGLILLGLGEVLRRKINPLASSGFSAAGIATLYASIYAASRMYDLFGPELAFALLALVSVAGVLLGTMSNRVLLALLSLTGAFAVPVLLATDDPSRVILPGYLLFLLATGLTLSGWRGGHYSHARRLAWWGTGIIGSLWLGTMHSESPTSALVFITIAWLMTITELGVSSRFFGSLRDQISWQGSCQSGFIRSESGEIAFNPLSLFTPESRWINALFGATIWSVIAGGLTIRSIDPNLVFIAPLTIAGLSIAAVFASMRIGLNPIAALASKTASPASLYMSALLINAALLLVATIATALGGWLEVIAWLAVGLGAIITSRRIRFRSLGIFGFVLMAYAGVRLLTYDLAQFHNATPAFIVFGLALSAWTAQMLAAAGAFAAATWQTRYKAERSIAAPIVLWLMAASLIHNQTLISSLSAATLMLGAGACWFGVKFPIRTLRINAFVLASIAMGALCLAQVGGTSSEPALDIQVIPMLIAALSWASIAALPKANYALRSTAAALVFIAGAIALVSLNASHGTPEMLLAQAVYLGIIAMLGKRLFAWSLGEIASLSSAILALVWGIYMLNLGDITLHLSPLATFDSFAPITILAAVLYSARTLTTRTASKDAPEELIEGRRMMSAVLFAVFWIFLLIASSIEITRVTYLFFDTGSAIGAAISIWWSLFAILSVSLGFKLARPLRWAGLTLLCIVGAKVLLYDTMALAPAARIIASITVGLIIITTGVVYSRLVESMKKSDSSSTPDPKPQPEPLPEEEPVE